MLKTLLCIGAGSCLGGMLRYLLSRFFLGLIPAAFFPIGTFLVNVAGCFAIGFFSGLYENGTLLNPQLKLFLTVGFCGGFTTFSTFVNEDASLLREGQFLSLCLYTGGSLFAGFVLLQVGRFCARLFQG